MNSEKKTKRIYHIEIDVVDDIEKFRDETGIKDNDIDFVPNYRLSVIIKNAIQRFSEIPTPGIYVTNSEIRIAVLNEEDVWQKKTIKKKKRYFELIELLLQCNTQNEFSEVNKEIDEIEGNYSKETLNKWGLMRRI